MNDDLAPLLQELPEPAAPPTITATVMARIARDSDERAAVMAAPVRRSRESVAWLWTFVGAAVVLVVAVNGWLSSGAFPDVTSARIGLGRASQMPVLGPFSGVLALGLAVYLVGLFAPLRSGQRE
ncbi:MAG: hypothetical protein ABIP90_11305 [Vicinamibacterales bacterium]